MPGLDGIPGAKVCGTCRVQDFIISQDPFHAEQNNIHFHQLSDHHRCIWMSNIMVVRYHETSFVNRCYLH